MNDFRPPWAPMGALLGIPICRDPDQPAGTARFELDPEEPRHIIRIWSSASSTGEVAFTEAQRQQIRDHYQAMDERAGRLLAEWRAFGRFAAAAVPEPSRPVLIAEV